MLSESSNLQSQVDAHKQAAAQHRDLQSEAEQRCEEMAAELKVADKVVEKLEFQLSQQMQKNAEASAKCAALEQQLAVLQAAADEAPRDDELRALREDFERVVSAAVKAKEEELDRNVAEMQLKVR